MYKLLICDDEELSREGLSEYVKSIRNDIEIIGYGRDGIEAISKISDLKPQIVLMDINLPFKDGLEVIETVKESEQQLSSSSVNISPLSILLSLAIVTLPMPRKRFDLAL